MAIWNGEPKKCKLDRPLDSFKAMRPLVQGMISHNAAASSGVTKSR